MVRVFVGPVLRVGSESGRQHRAEVRVRVKNCVKNGSIQQQQENEGWRTRRGSGAHRHACHRLITLTSLYRWVERLGGTEKRAGKSAGELELVGPVGSSWLNPPGLVSFFFRGAEFAKGRARSGATRVRRTGFRARGHDAKTISSPCRPLNRPPAPDGTTLHYYELEASTRRFQINTRAASGYFFCGISQGPSSSLTVCLS